MNNSANVKLVQNDAEEVLSLLETLKLCEEKVILKAKNDKNKFNNNNGFLDPTKDAALKNGLFGNFNGKATRQFIKDIIYVNPTKLDRSKQPRDQIAIKKYCEDDLGPRIKKFGLQYPPFVSETNGGLLTLDSGHNRSYFLETEYPGEDIPVFVLTDQYFVEDGVLYSIPADKKEYYKILSRINTNPKVEHKEMDMTSASTNLEDLFKQDPTFGGLNPSAEWFKNSTDKTYYKVMDQIFPGYFLNHRTRGKIFKMTFSGGKKGKVLPLDPDKVTGILGRIGWDTGVKKSGRKEFGEHIDLNNKAYIGLTDTNAHNFEGTVCNKIEELFVEENLKKGFDSIYLFCEIYSPVRDIDALKIRKESFLKRVKKYNEKASKLRIVDSKGNTKNYFLPTIEKVFFPSQLHNDPEKMYVYNKKMNRFDEDNSEESK